MYMLVYFDFEEFLVTQRLPWDPIRSMILMTNPWVICLWNWITQQTVNSKCNNNSSILLVLHYSLNGHYNALKFLLVILSETGCNFIQVVTCGSIPLESSFQSISRCVYVSTELHEYRGWRGKSADSSHRCLSWGLRHTEVGCFANISFFFFFLLTCKLEC